MKVSLRIGAVRLTAALDDSATARAVWDVLPVEGAATVWGEEIYFEIPVALDEAPDACRDVAVGDVAYWPPGKAFCVFFGPTPVSTGDRPRAYSPVNVFGGIDGDVGALRAVVDGARVRVERG